MDKVYDCIIIGAGMGGLTSALKLAASGKKVLVLEKQAVPGGVATNFKRKGFTFEAILHFVDGLGPEGEIRKFLDECGVSKKIDFIDWNEFGRIIYPEHDFIAGNNFDTLKAWCEDNFPAEREGIADFFRVVERFCKQFDDYTNSNTPSWLKLLLSPFFYPLIIKTSCLTVEQFISKKIKDKRLRAIIGTIWGFIGTPPSEASAFYFLIVLKGCLGEKTAFMKGGFSSLFNAMAERIRELGSEIKFATVVKEIVTEKGKRAVAVRTNKQEEFRAKAIISNANVIDTLSRLIDCDSLKQKYAKKLSSMQKSLSATSVYMGLNVPASAVGMKYPLMYLNMTYDHDETFRSCVSGDYRNCSLFVISHSQLDPGLAPAGKSTICAMTLDGYANWENLTIEEYRKKKKELADTIVAHLNKYLPGLSEHIEYLEVSTPKTMERFATLPQGTVYGFAQTVGQASINRLTQKTKIKGLFLAGAWTRPGCGVHGCLVSGKDAADMVLSFLKKQ